MNDLGNKIKALRMAKKISQPMLAERLGLTRSAVAAYENGTRSPSLDIIIKIAKLFGVTTDYLLGLDDDIKISINNLSNDEKEIVFNLIETLKINSEHNKALKNASKQDLMRLGFSLSYIDELKKRDD